jgi:hypothetical protein
MTFKGSIRVVCQRRAEISETFPIQISLEHWVCATVFYELAQ